MIITISGLPGSGKGTVGQMLAKRLRWPYYSVGNLRRQMAREHGMSLEEFNALGEKKAFTDLDADRWQAKLGKTKDKFVIEGRTGFHFIPDSMKVFLDVDLKEAARRIFPDAKHVRKFEWKNPITSRAQLQRSLQHRVASDTRRYQKYYGLNIFQKKHYDLWIDTTKKTPSKITDLIFNHLAKVSQKSKNEHNKGKSSSLVHRDTHKKSIRKEAEKRLKLAKKRVT